MNITQNNLCIIPARGGSKRIPRKNIKDFLGKPIIAYSIDAAINSGLFTEVMVSTDDMEIAEVAKNYNACVPFLRSNETANDFATTMDVINEVVNEYRQVGKHFDTICCIYATAPFVNIMHLTRSYNLFISNNFDSLFPVMPFCFPIQRSLKVCNNVSTFVYPDYIHARSQDLEKRYHDAGQYYWMKNSLARKGKSIMTENTGAYIITELDGQDIDNDIDWKLAELKYELIQSTK